MVKWNKAQKNVRNWNTRLSLMANAGVMKSFSRSTTQHTSGPFLLGTLLTNHNERAYTQPHTEETLAAASPWGIDMFRHQLVD